MAAADGEVHLPVALGWGVRGWVSRQDGVNDLLDALVDVAAGEAHLPAAPLHAMFAATLNDRPDAVLPGARPLTEREAAVLDCLAAGMSRHDIGVALELSDNTVRTYVRRILRKLHVHSASAAVALTAMSRSETRSDMTNGHTNGQTTNGHHAATRLPNGRLANGASTDGALTGTGMAMSEVQVHG
jgi:DNA-binding NarL/FixJ family response regulator